MSAVDINNQNGSEPPYQLEVEVILDLEDRIPGAVEARVLWGRAHFCVSEEDWPLSVAAAGVRGDWMCAYHQWSSPGPQARVSAVDGSPGRLWWVPQPTEEPSCCALPSVREPGPQRELPTGLGRGPSPGACLLPGAAGCQGAAVPHSESLSLPSPRARCPLTQKRVQT